MSASPSAPNPQFRFYDTLSKKVVTFTPPAGRPVTMYNCGPTVYSYAHIGNFRSFLFADTLRRALEYHGVAVRQIMNITDVGHLTDDTLEQGLDKLEAAAKAQSLTPWDIAARFTEAFQQDRKTLGILDAERYPKASDHVPQMQEMIAKLIKDGFAYVSPEDGEVYFDVKRFPGYGKLSGNTLEAVKEHVRAAISERSNKRDQRDFALWKQEAGHLMQWPAPWAPAGSGPNGGFPGWHIECSAMSRAYLGDTLDFHTGGEDNIFPHHEAEIAQSEAFSGKPFVRIWMHARHLLVHEQKMAKSAGNFFTVRDALRGRASSELAPGAGNRMAHPVTHPAALRLALIEPHYRQHMNYVPEQVPDREAFARRIAEATAIEGSPGFAKLPPLVERHPEEAKFAAALREDLNVSGGLAVVAELVRIFNRAETPAAEKEQARTSLRAIDHAIGIASVWHAHESARTGPSDDEAARIAGLIAQRAAARKAKDFAKGDQIRKALEAEGIKLVDGPTGTTWERMR